MHRAQEKNLSPNFLIMSKILTQIYDVRAYVCHTTQALTYHLNQCDYCSLLLCKTVHFLKNTARHCTPFDKSVDYCALFTVHFLTFQTIDTIQLLIGTVQLLTRIVHLNGLKSALGVRSSCLYKGHSFAEGGHRKIYPLSLVYSPSLFDKILFCYLLSVNWKLFMWYCKAWNLTWWPTLLIVGGQWIKWEERMTNFIICF